MDVDDTELLILLSEGRRELTTSDADLDLAFQLQMQEAIKLSSASKPSSSSSSSHQSYQDSPSASGVAHLIAKFDTCKRGRTYSEFIDVERMNTKENRNRLIHDQFFPREIIDVPEDNWRRTEDFVDKPNPFFPSSNDDVFRVYFKGLVSNETVLNVEMAFAGIGVAICDTNDCCLYESRKSFLIGGIEGESDVLELKALIEAMNAAITLGLNRVHIFCNSNSVYKYFTGKWRPTDNKTLPLIHHLNQIQEQFAYCSPVFVPRSSLKFAYELAKDAISSQATKLAENPSRLLEQCTICFEYTYIAQMFTINKCLHKYCFSCMRKHVEAKLHQGKLPQCPHEGCKSDLEIEACKKFLDPKLYDIMNSHIKEASIPPSEKVYCPFSNCSALMSKTELQEHAATSSTGKRKCVKCHRFFCMNCNVSWHVNMTCSEYKESSEYKSANETKLKLLATSKRWRQCVKCKNLVELAAGCFHICCRCGYEFCYTCGAEYVEKKATCKCPIWDEDNIIYVM